LTIIFSCQTKHEPYTAEQLLKLKKIIHQNSWNSEAILYVNGSQNPDYMAIEIGKPTSYWLKAKNKRFKSCPWWFFAVFAVDNGGDERYDMYI
jgi:hypothetical protein